MTAITRAEWAREHAQCMICGERWIDHLHVHEIACGPARAKALEEPATWLRLCWRCHLDDDGVHNYAVWPIVRQLALKKVHDPEHYDRVKVNELRGRAAEAITEAEVMEEVWKLQQ